MSRYRAGARPAPENFAECAGNIKVGQALGLDAVCRAARQREHNAMYNAADIASGRTSTGLDAVCRGAAA
jgi:hypothetical protein